MFAPSRKLHELFSMECEDFSGTIVSGTFKPRFSAMIRLCSTCASIHAGREGDPQPPKSVNFKARFRRGLMFFSSYLGIEDPSLHKFGFLYAQASSSGVFAFRHSRRNYVEKLVWWHSSSSLALHFPSLPWKSSSRSRLPGRVGNCLPGSIPKWLYHNLGRFFYPAFCLRALLKPAVPNSHFLYFPLSLFWSHQSCSVFLRTFTSIPHHRQCCLDEVSSLVDNRQAPRSSLTPCRNR